MLVVITFAVTTGGHLDLKLKPWVQAKLLNLRFFPDHPNIPTPALKLTFFKIS